MARLRILLQLAFVSLIAVHALSAIRTGPEPGTNIPDFSLPDQNGKTQSLKTIAGPKGALIVFYRSADW
jgi:hypothetical protein